MQNMQNTNNNLLINDSDDQQEFNEEEIIEEKEEGLFLDLDEHQDQNKGTNNTQKNNSQNQKQKKGLDKNVKGEEIQHDLSDDATLFLFLLEKEEYYTSEKISDRNVQQEIMQTLFNIKQNPALIIEEQQKSHIIRQLSSLDIIFEEAQKDIDNLNLNITKTMFQTNNSRHKNIIIQKPQELINQKGLISFQQDNENDCLNKKEESQKQNLLKSQIKSVQDINSLDGKQRKQLMMNLAHKIFFKQAPQRSYLKQEKTEFSNNRKSFLQQFVNLENKSINKKQQIILKMYMNLIHKKLQNQSKTNFQVDSNSPSLPQIQNINIQNITIKSSTNKIVQTERENTSHKYQKTQQCHEEGELDHQNGIIDEYQLFQRKFHLLNTNQSEIKKSRYQSNESDLKTEVGIILKNKQKCLNQKQNKPEALTSLNSPNEQSYQQFENSFLSQNLQKTNEKSQQSKLNNYSLVNSLNQSKIGVPINLSTSTQANTNQKKKHLLQEFRSEMQDLEENNIQNIQQIQKLLTKNLKCVQKNNFKNEQITNQNYEDQFKAHKISAKQYFKKLGYKQMNNNMPKFLESMKQIVVLQNLKELNNQLKLSPTQEFLINSSIGALSLHENATQKVKSMKKFQFDQSKEFTTVPLKFSKQDLLKQKNYDHLSSDKDVSSSSLANISYLTKMAIVFDPKDYILQDYVVNQPQKHQ